MSGFIVFCSFLYIAQIIFVIFILTNEMENGEHKIFKTKKFFFLNLLPMTFYVLLLISVVYVFNEHFKKDEGDL